jgi:PAS domain S-box-containing protein
MKQRQWSRLKRFILSWKSSASGAILQTRFLVVVFVLVLVHVVRWLSLPQWFNWVFLAYVALNAAIVFALRASLSRKRLRILRELLDLCAISLFVRATGGLESSWFVLYLFPVMSASRFIGNAGIAVLATLTAGGYAWSTSILAQLGDRSALLSFVLRALTLGGASLMAVNLVQTRDWEEARLVAAIERIDRLLLAGAAGEQVMTLILKTAMDLTGSDLSSMVLLDGEVVSPPVSEVVVSQNGPNDQHEHDKARASKLLQDNRHRVLQSLRPLSMPEASFLRLWALQRQPMSEARWSGRLVPLLVDDRAVGVLGVFTRRSFHYYTTNDLRKLASLAPLVAMARKNVKLFHESRGRLALLYKIGRQLNTEHGLDEVFRSVVNLVSEELGSEEAALFVPEEVGDILEKKAVSGPGQQTTHRLSDIENEYRPGFVSLTRGVYDTKSAVRQNQIPDEEAHTSEYSRELPSGTTRHYLGVPLLLGDEVLGVIRVLNKKAPHYAPRPGAAILADDGFSEEDLDLLSFIATQIAAAIRNAKFVEQKRYLENLVYTSPDPTIVVDNRGRVRKFNRACEDIWHRSEAEVLGESVGQFYPSVEHAREIGRLLRERQDHRLHDHSCLIRGADGGDIPIRLSAALLLNDEGQPLGSVGIFRDQRPLLLLEEEKIRNEKLAALGRLAQTASHDIKHDFGTILIFLRFLERKLSRDADLLKAVRSIRTAAEEALDKIQRMLLAARPKPPDRQVLSLRFELVRFHQSVEQRAAAARVEFSVSVPDCDPIVLADPELFRQVFANLFGNSLDAIRTSRERDLQRAAGKIEASLKIDGETVLLAWHDDGCGMSAEVLRNAFAAFYTTKDMGSGLGLSVTKTIVEHHEGTIEIDSTEGIGTFIHIVLPLAPSPEVASLEGPARR